MTLDNTTLTWDNRFIKQVSNNQMEVTYVATININPFGKFGNKEFKTKEEAERYADSYNMGADYSYMSVFTIQRQK